MFSFLSVFFLSGFHRGEWRVFSGNELGALLGWWAIRCYREQYPDRSLSDCYLIASTVSSKMCRSIANVDGLNFIETLTGFKWMGKNGSVPLCVFVRFGASVASLSV